MRVMYVLYVVYVYTYDMNVCMYGKFLGALGMLFVVSTYGTSCICVSMSGMYGMYVCMLCVYSI